MTVTIKEYPQYATLPAPLRTALSMLRFELTGQDEGELLVENDFGSVSVQDLEFLNMEALVEWAENTLPEYDIDYLKAASRLHKEYYEDELFSYWAVDESDLLLELLFLKDEYEMLICTQRQEKVGEYLIGFAYGH